MNAVREFACVADAVAFYLERGYHTISEGGNSSTPGYARIMVRTGVVDSVFIRKDGFLKVVASEITGGKWEAQS